MVEYRIKDVPEVIDKKIRIFMATEGITRKDEAIIKILKRYFEDEKN